MVILRTASESPLRRHERDRELHTLPRRVVPRIYIPCSTGGRRTRTTRCTCCAAFRLRRHASDDRYPQRRLRPIQNRVRRLAAITLEDRGLGARVLRYLCIGGGGGVCDFICWHDLYGLINGRGYEGGSCFGGLWCANLCGVGCCRWIRAVYCTKVRSRKEASLHHYAKWETNVLTIGYGADGHRGTFWAGILGVPFRYLFPQFDRILVLHDGVVAFEGHGIVTSIRRTVQEFEIPRNSEPESLNTIGTESPKTPDFRSHQRAEALLKVGAEAVEVSRTLLR